MAYTVRCWCPTCSELREWRLRAGQFQPTMLEQMHSTSSVLRCIRRGARLYLSAWAASLMNMAKEKDPMAAGRKANQKAAQQKRGIEQRYHNVVGKDEDGEFKKDKMNANPKHRKGS